MSVGLREIQLFVAAYEERSFTAAAKRENATQSGVSQHIRKLEESFEVKLFSREGGSVVPTKAADTYYRQCLDVLRAHDAASQALRHFSVGLDGEISIGLMPTMTRTTLALALARFAEKHPNVSVVIREAFSAVLTDRVISGELAFAVVPAFAPGTSLRSRRFVRTPEMLVTRGGSEKRTIHELARDNSLKLVLPHPQNTRRVTIDTYLSSNHVPVDRILELDTMFGTLDLVAKTDWVTILPGIMVAADSRLAILDINPLTDPPLWLDLALIESSRRSLSAAERAFLSILEEETHTANSLALDLAAS